MPEELNSILALPLTPAYHTSPCGQPSARHGSLFGPDPEVASVHGGARHRWIARGRYESRDGHGRRLLHGHCRERALLRAAGLAAGPSCHVPRHSALQPLDGVRAARSIVLRVGAISPDRAPWSLRRSARRVVEVGIVASDQLPRCPPTERVSMGCTPYGGGPLVRHGPGGGLGTRCESARSARFGAASESTLGAAGACDPRVTSGPRRFGATVKEEALPCRKGCARIAIV